MTKADRITKTPPPAYYAVIFTSRRTPGDDGYAETARHLLSLAARQAGFLGMESARDEDGFGITVSYWKDLDAIHAWSKDVAHREAQARGRSRWYHAYRVRICKVLQDDVFPRDDSRGPGQTDMPHM